MEFAFQAPAASDPRGGKRKGRRTRPSGENKARCWWVERGCGAVRALAARCSFLELCQGCGTEEGEKRRGNGGKEGATPAKKPPLALWFWASLRIWALLS